jgi:hypothetical protein
MAMNQLNKFNEKQWKESWKYAEQNGYKKK